MKGKNLLFSILAFLLGFSTITYAAAAYQLVPQNDGEGESQIQIKNNPEAYFHMLRVNKKTGTINPADVVKASQQADLLFKDGSEIDLTWENKGPDNVGGRTRALIFDNKDANATTLIAGGVTGGLWKSENLGLTWNKINITDANLNVSALIQDENGTIYAGTGDGYDGTVFGTGIYKSTDGDNFTVIESTIPDVNSEEKEWAFIYKLALQNNRLLAATNTGLKYTNNDGAEWSTAVYIDSTGTAIELTGVCTDIKVSGNGLIAAVVDNKVYTAVSDPVQFELQSKYEEVNDSTINFPDKLPFKNVGRAEIAISPSAPETIYVTMAKLGFGSLKGVFKSINNGKTWRVILPENNNFDIYEEQGLHANTIAVSPTNPNKICVGGKNLWVGTEVDPTGYYDWGTAPYTSGALLSIPTYVHYMHHDYIFRPGHPETMIICTDGGISISNDNLETFRNIIKNYSTTQCNSIAFNQFGNVFTGTMNNGSQYIGDGTNGPTFGKEIWSNGANNAGTGGYVAISQISKEVMFLTNPGETQTEFRRTEDQGFSFANEFIPGTITTTNAVQPFIMWESFNDYKSGDSITLYARTLLPKDTTVWLQSYNRDYPFKYTLPHTLEEGDSMRVQDPITNIFLLAIRNSLYMSREALDFSKEPEWWQLAEAKGIATAITVSADGKSAYVGLESGELVRVDHVRDAYSFETADMSSPYSVIASSTIFTAENQALTSVAVDPQNNEHVILTLGNYGEENYVYETFNALDEEPVFESIQGNLPKAPAYSSLIEMNDGERIIIGTEFGVYASTAPNEWIALNNGMGKVPVTMLRQQTMTKWGFEVPTGDPANPTEYFPGITNTGVIYASTYGRGTFEARNFVGIQDQPEDGSITSSTVSSLNVYPNPVQNNAFVEMKLNEAQQVSTYIYNLNGQLLQIHNAGTMAAGDQKIELNTSKLNAGTYIINVQAGSQNVQAKFIKVD